MIVKLDLSEKTKTSLEVEIENFEKGNAKKEKAEFENKKLELKLGRNHAVWFRNNEKTINGFVA